MVVTADVSLGEGWWGGQNTMLWGRACMHRVSHGVIGARVRKGESRGRSPRRRAAVCRLCGGGISAPGVERILKLDVIGHRVAGEAPSHRQI